MKGERESRAPASRGWLDRAAEEELHGLQRQEDAERRLPGAELQHGEEGREQGGDQRAQKGM
jgi:hypothetical protein